MVKCLIEATEATEASSERRQQDEKKRRQELQDGDPPPTSARWLLHVRAEHGNIGDHRDASRGSKTTMEEEQRGDGGYRNNSAALSGAVGETEWRVETEKRQREH